MRRDEEYVEKQVMAMEVEGNRKKGRPRRRWYDSIKDDMREKELTREDTQDRVRWRRTVKNADPI